MSEIYGPLTKEIEARVLEDWMRQLRDIAEPRIRFQEDFSKMQQEAMQESQRIAKGLHDEIEAYL